MLSDILRGLLRARSFAGPGPYVPRAFDAEGTESPPVSLVSGLFPGEPPCLAGLLSASLSEPAKPNTKPQVRGLYGMPYNTKPQVRGYKLQEWKIGHNGIDLDIPILAAKVKLW